MKFNKNIVWKKSYTRSNITSKQKHILCFPNHRITGHRTKEFCRHDIQIELDETEANLKNVVMFGYFRRSDIIRDMNQINTAINKKEIDEKLKDRNRYYTGEQNIYKINSNPKYWNCLNELSKNKANEFVFCVDLYTSYFPDLSKWSLFSSISSPPFKICSYESKRQKYIKELTYTQSLYLSKYNINNNNIQNEENENNETDSNESFSNHGFFYQIGHKGEINLYKY